MESYPSQLIQHYCREVDWLTGRMAFKLHIAADILLDILRDHPEVFVSYFPAVVADSLHIKEWRKNFYNCLRDFSEALRNGMFPHLQFPGEEMTMLMITKTASDYELEGLYDDGWAHELQSIPSQAEDSNYQLVISEILRNETEEDAENLSEFNFEKLALDSKFLHAQDWFQPMTALRNISDHYEGSISNGENDVPDEDVNSKKRKLDINDANTLSNATATSASTSTTITTTTTSTTDTTSTTNTTSSSLEK